MIKDTDLHLYLEAPPKIDIFMCVLDKYGFVFNNSVERTKTDPQTYFFTWKPPVSSGFQLVYFDTLFPDDLNTGKYESFAILSGDQLSSNEDLVMLDSTASKLLNSYGGRLHNPHRIEKISTSYLLSGEQFSILNTEKGLASSESP